MSYTDRAAERVAAAYGIQEGEDPSQAAGPFLEFILGFLKDCMSGGATSASILQQGKRIPLRQRLAMRRQARRQGLDPEDTIRVAERLAAEATEEELSGFLAENP